MKRFIGFILLIFTMVLSFASFSSYAEESGSGAVILEEENESEEKESEEKDVTKAENDIPESHRSASPLFEFDYAGKHIQTFGTYSVIDGKVCYTHRFFVKDGQLVVIDQELNPTPTGVFIHYDDGKSYIVVLDTDGKIVSLGTEDELQILQDFNNQGIVSMANNISKDSSILFFEYDDGGVAAYDCTTGEVLYKEAGTGTDTSAGSLIGGYLSKFFGGGLSRKRPTSAAAQSIVSTLNDSGLTLENLVDSGLAEKVFKSGEGTSKAPDPMSAEGNSAQGNAMSMGAEGNTQSGKPSGGIDSTHQSQNGKAVTVKDAEDALNKTITASVHEMTENEKKEVSKLVNEVAEGKKTASEATNNISDMIPELSEADLNEVKGELEAVEAARAEQIKAEAAADDAMYGKTSTGTEGKPSVSTVGGKGTEEASGDAEADGDTEASGKGGKGDKNGAGKEFIKSDTSDNYVAVYNAETGEYEIFSVEELMENPDAPQDELAKISDKTKLDAINKLLANEKDKSTTRGVLLYSLVAVAICSMITLMVVRPKRRRHGQK